MKSSKNLHQTTLDGMVTSKNELASLPMKSFPVKIHWRKYKNAGPSKKSSNKASKSKKKKYFKSSSTLAVADDCKESLQLAHSLHIQEMKDLFNSF